MFGLPSSLKYPAMRVERHLNVLIAGLALSLAHVVAGAAGVGAAPAVEQLTCAPQETGYDSLVVECPLSGTATPQRLRFKANFSGSHDDTMVSMATTLDEAPLVCDKDSKISLMGEDGDVSLHCDFSLAANPGTKNVLRVKVTWSHAQYTDFEFSRN